MSRLVAWSFIALFKVMRTEVVILDTISKNHVGGREHRVRDRENGLLGAAAALDPIVASRSICPSACVFTWPGSISATRVTVHFIQSFSWVHRPFRRGPPPHPRRPLHRLARGTAGQMTPSMLACLPHGAQGARKDVQFWWLAGCAAAIGRGSRPSAGRRRGRRARATGRRSTRMTPVRAVTATTIRNTAITSVDIISPGPTWRKA